MGKDGILVQLTKALVETALGAELTNHLGYEAPQTSEVPHAPVPQVPEVQVPELQQVPEAPPVRVHRMTDNEPEE